MSVASETLKAIRKLNRGAQKLEPLQPDYTGQAASDVIRNLLLGDDPCMAARFGANEIDATLRSLDCSADGGVLSKSKRFITGEIGFFWWSGSIKRRMSLNAGFFPPTANALSRFGEMMLRDVQLTDVLASWLPEERRLTDYFRQAIIVPLNATFPFDLNDPWMSALEGKTVLIVHPFEATIQQQFEKRELLFSNPRVLPKFELKTLKAVQTAGANKADFGSWFDALRWMCDEIDRTQFDIAIIGAGAYGLPLAAHVKRMGKKAVHMGAATQLLFGIKGGRWDSHGWYNEHWVRPAKEETPPKAHRIESGCYW